MSTSEKADLKALFRQKQQRMLVELQGDRENVTHPGSLGQATEDQWRQLLTSYLPSRYRVRDGFVVDSDGDISEQIDVIIFDRQYSPSLFESGDVEYIPAEGVYAALEVKQVLNRSNLRYASQKMESVRRLKRTSESIVYAGGTYEPRIPPQIIGGILTTKSGWSPPFGRPFHKSLDDLSKPGSIDIGCALANGSFEAQYQGGSPSRVDVNDADISLVSFVFRLLARLQQMGTVTAIDYSVYGKSLGLNT